MSHLGVSSQRSLTLTEELEKLEQSITLTLQGVSLPKEAPETSWLMLSLEIDHNFSRAHRIITASILPIVERYAEHSKDVWEGSKVCSNPCRSLNPLNAFQFWKQFFEASANVSLSSYEEPLEEEAITEDLTGTTPSSAYGSPSLAHDGNITPDNQRGHSPPDDQSILTSTPSHSTPRGRITGQPPASIATYSSPYEALRREVQGGRNEDPSTSTMPSTPRTHQQSPTPESSPFHPPSTSRHPSHRTPANDVLLHRVLDKNWRVQATPHSQAQRLPHRGVAKAAETPLLSPQKNKRRAYQRDLAQNLDSSPAIPTPQLHTEIFDSPVRRPRIPGVSVFTPARGQGPKPQTSFGRDDDPTGRSVGGIWDSDSDDEAGLEGMSPPKTMQFHIPQSRLLRTPGLYFLLFCSCSSIFPPPSILSTK